MYLLINIFFSVLHFLLTYIVFSILLISNNTKVLFILLLLMSIIKILYCLFGRCVLTLYEYNEYFSPISQLLSNTLTYKLDDKRTEEILINIGLLIALNKLLIIFFLKYYKINI